MTTKKRTRGKVSPSYARKKHRAAKWEYYAQVLERWGLWQPRKVERT